MLEEAGALNARVRVKARMPQSLLAGIYHEFESGVSLTFDLLWLDFSRFAFTQVSVGDVTVEPQTSEFEDIVAGTVGVRIPLRDSWELRVGAVYLDGPIEDENRTLALRLDSVWGAGVGFKRRLGKRRSLSLNLNYYALGDAPVQTPELPLVGVVSGEYETRTGLMLDFTYGWKFQ